MSMTIMVVIMRVSLRLVWARVLWSKCRRSINCLKMLSAFL